MKLSELRAGEKAYVIRVEGSLAFRKRIAEMGFITGQEVTNIKAAPLRDPVEYSLMGYNVSLRASEADLIEVGFSLTPNGGGETGAMHGRRWRNHARHDTANLKEMKIALVGNPNSGKTTIFNFASKMKERVGNYSGVTVAAKEAEMKWGDYNIILTDLPGTYSLSSFSPEELYVIDYLFNEKPDLIINVVDSSNLERNLFLTTQLLDLDIPMIIALNMWDELERNGDKLKINEFSELLGIQVVPTSGKRGEGINELMRAATTNREWKGNDRGKASINFGNDIEKSIQTISETIRYSKDAFHRIPERLVALKLLEDQDLFAEGLQETEETVRISRVEQGRIEKLLGRDTLTIINDARYGFISGALKETFTESATDKLKLTRRIDSILTHHWAGLPLFFGLIWLMFYSTFRLGEYPVSLIESGVSLLSGYLGSVIPAGIFNDMVVNGIIGGVGGVIVFLPNILILFLFISLMEDTGYMARTAFIMDKVMHRAGLHGKSFIPLLMGFGCNVPAVMATRTIESKRDRLITMMIIPFMSCSARLPVYALFISAFFAQYRSGILFLLYFTGVIIAFLTALFMNRTIFRKLESPFIMELPPYRFPTMKAVMRHMWFKSAFFLKKMGGVILISSVIIWALGYFPTGGKDILPEGNPVTSEVEHSLLPDRGSNPWPDIVAESGIPTTVSVPVQMDSSYLASLGRFFSPVFSPLGFDWKMSVGILSGLAAKEVVVSTMGVLYHTGENNRNGLTLDSRLRNSDNSKLAPWRAFSFMIFILLYFPCIGTLAAIKRESGSTGWMIFTLIMTTAIAWLAAFAVFQTGVLITG